MLLRGKESSSNRDFSLYNTLVLHRLPDHVLKGMILYSIFFYLNCKLLDVKLCQKSGYKKFEITIRNTRKILVKSLYC